MRSTVAVPLRAAACPSFLAAVMGKTDQKRPNNPAMAETDQEGEAVDNAFDLWLRRGLHQLYDTVAKEPIPEDLLRMIEDDRNSQQK